MAKIVNISEIHPTLGFTEFDILEKYRKSFNESELGKLHSVFPFECMAKAAGLSDRRLGRRNRFSPSAKIALMVLKAYTGFSDRQLVEHLNGNIHYQIFCGIMIPPSLPITNFKIVSAIRNEIASRLDIDSFQTFPVEGTDVEAVIGADYHQQLLDEIELLDGAADEFDQERVSRGNLSPVFFGSALTNFGVETFLQHFLKMTTSPLPRKAITREISPFNDDFSAFVFKIQANMNKAHRDRIAFMRIVSGKFEAGMEVNHVQGGKKIRLSQPQQMMAQDRKIVEEAYAGDIIGVFDPGIFSIGDTLCLSNEKFEFEGIPTFAPEHFARVRQIDTMKRKQFLKGVSQIAQEGAIQIFQEFNTGMEEIIVGVVGVLQFEVLTYRLKNEYNVDVRLEQLPFEYIRWVENPEEVDVAKIQGTSDMKRICDLKGNPLLLFINSWSVGMVEERNPNLKLSEFGKN